MHHNSEKDTAKGITWDDVELLIIGAGIMGASLTQAYAQSGFKVGVVDLSDEILEQALTTIERELEAGRIAGIDTARREQEEAEDQINRLMHLFTCSPPHDSSHSQFTRGRPMRKAVCIT